jgi:hypothetical protein
MMQLVCLLAGLTGCIGNVLLDGKRMPLVGVTERFDVVSFGLVEFTCGITPVDIGPNAGASSSPAWQLPVIVVCSIVGFLLVFLVPSLAAILCLRKRRRPNAKGTELVLAGLLFHMFQVWL